MVNISCASLLYIRSHCCVVAMYINLVSVQCGLAHVQQDLNNNVCASFLADSVHLSPRAAMLYLLHI